MPWKSLSHLSLITRFYILHNIVKSLLKLKVMLKTDLCISTTPGDQKLLYFKLILAWSFLSIVLIRGQFINTMLRLRVVLIRGQILNTMLRLRVVFMINTMHGEIFSQFLFFTYLESSEHKHSIGTLEYIVYQKNFEDICILRSKSY